MSSLNLLPFSLPLNVQVNATSLRSLPRRTCINRLRLLPTVVVCVLVLVYIRFAAWSTQTHPIEPLTNPEYEDSTERPPRILLVSALFPLNHAKHSREDYMSWLRNFVGPDGIQSDLYFYTTPELEDLVSSLHLSTSTSETQDSNGRHKLTINTTYTSPFSIPPLAPYTSKYHEMHAWDRERAIHNPDLYAVWNAKPWLLEHALLSLSHSKQAYDYAFWVDAGSFRAAHPFRLWPDPRRVEKVFSSSEHGKDRDKVFIPLYGVPGLREYAWRFEMGPVDMDLSEGSFFGSTPYGISWFSKTFYETHDWYINTSPPPRSALSSRIPAGLLLNHKTMNAPFHFVGKDQTLINTMLFRYPERFVGVLVPSRMGLLPPSPPSPPSPPPTTSPSPSNHPSNTPPSTPHILTLSSLLTRLSHSIPFLHAKLCGDWYFYQWFLASEREREEARGMGWVGCTRASGGKGIGREAVDIEGMLRALFGGRWVEGRRAGGA